MIIKKPRRWKWIGATVVFVLLCGWLLTFLWSQHLFHQGIEISRDWARLDPLPASASQIDVTVTGGFFTRGFVVTFVAPMKDIDAWLASSPGTAGVAAVQKVNDRHVYPITPGGGAGFAEVVVDVNAQRVWVHTYWS